MKPTEVKGRVINCVLPKGTSSAVLEVLFEKGFTRVNFSYARGFDIHDEPNARTGMPKYVEKEMLAIIAKDEAEGEELFNLVFEVAGINRLGGGLIYMSHLCGAVPFILPQIAHEETTAHHHHPSPSSHAGSSTPPASMAAKSRD